MAKKPYLEFSVDERHLSAKLWKLKKRAGLISPPDLSHCAACLQMEGTIEAHREDYSFSDETSLVPLCYRCHRVVHMRDRFPHGWDHYVELIRSGYQFAATKSIGVVSDDMVNMAAPKLRLSINRFRTVLDDINDGNLLVGTRADRVQRLEDMAEELKNWGKPPSLF